MSEIQFESGVSLAGLTTLAVGGCARYLARPNTIAQIRSCLERASREGLEVFVLGGGSNLLVSDNGFEGLVLSPQNTEIECIEKSAESVVLKVGAGCVWDDLVEFCVQAGYSGIECLSGIPGCVGAAPIQNIGAYGQEVAEVIESVVCVAKADGSSREYTRADCGFGYRTSSFKTHRLGLDVVVEVTFRLQLGPPATPRYPELIKACGENCNDLRVLRETVLKLRRRKSMVYDQADANHRSAGSFFVNPIVDKVVLKQVHEALAALSIPIQDMPCFEQGTKAWKLSAAWLMDRAGFGKGFGDGAAGLSTNHCLAIVNRGGAQASDIAELAREIQEGVLKRFGVTLAPEPVYLGGFI